MSEPVAGGGLLSRRLFLTGGAAFAGALAVPALGAEALAPWRTVPGAVPSDYGAQAPHAQLRREGVGGLPTGPGSGSSSTPLEAMNGTLTPNALHFERHHAGIPDIDPARHRLVIHGAVRRALEFRYEDLLAYPMVSRVHFLECSGNSWRNTLPEAQDLSCGVLNGLLSSAEWTGIPLHVLLDEAGVEPGSNWVIAEGADASGNNRSLPMDFALDGAMVALFQNGEPLRPAQGWPMRLFVPGCEGNLSIKWLRSLKVQARPAYTREETSHYTDLLPDGRANMFSLRMGVKSLITSPSGTMQLTRHGIHAVSGLAWSGHGGIRRVEVSADGGASWADAELQSEPGPLRPVRFRIPWRWQGAPAALQSRATDTAGNVQPTRSAALARYSPAGFYHFNGIQSWQVDARGRVRNVHL